MFEITFGEMWAVITVLWIAARVCAGVKAGRFSLRKEAKMLLVYTCLVVIARMVYFPLRHVDGRIGTLKFDRSQPLWINLVPFTFLFERYEGWQINILGNIAMFIPVGIVWPVCFKKLDTFKKTVLAGFVFTLLIELTQLPFYERCSDVDDIILNTLGVMIGAGIVSGIRKKKKSRA